MFCATENAAGIIIKRKKECNFNVKKKKGNGQASSIIPHIGDRFKHFFQSNFNYQTGLAVIK